MASSSRGASVLEQSLDRLRLHGSVYCLFEGLRSWGLRLPAAPEARFHAVREGRCWLRVEDDPPMEVSAGELILLPRGDRHDVLATPESTAVDVAEAFGAADPFQKVFRMGSGDLQASLVCGGFSFEDRDLHPLPTCLPRVLRLRSDEPAGAALKGLLDLADAELAGPHVASDAVLGRLSEILFITAVRVFASDAEVETRGWLGAIGDAVVGPVLASIHSNPAAELSVRGLAESAGVSKTTLNERFQEMVGVSPARYVTRWRMVEARRLLSQGLTVARVAQQVGYSSEAAFSRAFHREIGAWPSTYRPSSADPTT